MFKILVAALAMTASTAQAQKWRFVVTGDGRSDGSGKRPEDKNGVNTLITAEIAKQVIAEKAKFLMWTGDLVLGARRPEDLETQLMTWRSLMQPVYDKHIPILACRGNHEAYSGGSVAVWNKVFSGPYAMPDNGPHDGKNLSFFHLEGPVLAVGLDQYTVQKEIIDQAWLDAVLAKYPRPFVFTMGHEPAFMDGAHKDTMDSSATKRDEFWESLIKAGSRVFFCGHDHLYDHMVVTRKDGTPGPEMHQVVAGTAGAPFYKMGDYTGNNTGWNLKRMKHIDNLYGYVVVEIDGKKATITYKARVAPGKYKAMDSFSYSVK